MTAFSSRKEDGRHDRGAIAGTTGLAPESVRCPWPARSGAPKAEPNPAGAAAAISAASSATCPSVPALKFGYHSRAI